MHCNGVMNIYSYVVRVALLNPIRHVPHIVRQSLILPWFDDDRYDRARGVEIGNKDIKLEHLEEAFTTSNWIVRIYKVKPPNNRW